MAIANIISAIGNNSSIYPLLVRDCGIEVPTKIGLTYKQNKEDKKIAWLAARERFIDEYSVSAVWLGGIPLIDWAGKKIIKSVKGLNLNSDVNMKLFKEEDGIQGLDYNIKKFANNSKAKAAVEDLKNVKANKELFKKMTAVKFGASIAIPIALMGFVIPKLIFASTAKRMEKYRKEKNIEKPPVYFGNKNFDQFLNTGKNKTVSFKGNWASVLTNMTTVQKMAATDGGYAVGRVVTARKKNEAIDIAFKMAGMMYLNFVAPNQIKKVFDKVTKVNLDPVMLADKDFIKAVKNNNLSLPKSDSAKDLLEFIDNNPKSIFVKFADKFGKVKMIDGDVRDPRAYVDTKKLAGFKKDIEDFMKKTVSAGQFESYVKKAKAAKSISIVLNVALSSFLLAWCLPKAQFAFRKLVTGSDLEPGLIDNNQLGKKKNENSK